MARRRELRLAAAAAFESELSAPLVRYTGRRVNATVGSTTSAATELPLAAAGKSPAVIELRLTDSIYIRFGHSDMGAAAADTNSSLVVAGEKIVIVPEVSTGVPYTHFRAIRVGSADVALQIESVETE